MKIINISDVHILGKNPIARKDDLVTVQFQKLKEIIDYSNKIKAPIIINGDLVNYPYLGYNIFSTLYEVLNKAKYGIYLVFGQHDLFYHNLKSLYSTLTGALITTKIINTIEDWNNTYPKYKFDFLNWGEKNINETNGNFFISHAPVIPQKMVPFWMKEENTNYLIFENLENHYNLILCGDWHKQYIYKTKYSLLINPGPVLRKEVNLDYSGTIPSMIEIDLDILEYKIIELKTAYPYENVISEDHLLKMNSNRKTQLEIQQFINNIQIGQKDSSKFLTSLTKNLEKLPYELHSYLSKLMLKVFGSKIKY